MAHLWIACGCVVPVRCRLSCPPLTRKVVMESVWYYARGGAQTGPVSFGDLQAAAASGQLGADDLVWREGTAEWVAARTVAGLFPAAAAPPPAIPNPPPPPPPTPPPRAPPGRKPRRGA